MACTARSDASRKRTSYFATRSGNLFLQRKQNDTLREHAFGRDYRIRTNMPIILSCSAAYFLTLNAANLGF